MALLQVSIRWNQSQSLSNHMPRFTKTEGSPFKPLQSRRTARSYPGFSTGFMSARDSDPSAPSTAYRLPRLPIERHLRSRMQKDYVYKQPISESHFLLRKDPRNGTPVVRGKTPELQIKSKTKKYYPPQTAAATTGDRPFPSSLKAHRLFPHLKHSIINAPNLPIINFEKSKKTNAPETPPQSEVDYSHLPTLHIRTQTPTPPPSTAKRFSDNLPIPPVENNECERRLTWQLSPYDNKNFDKQGLGPNQGPFSRELPRKCVPPANWLRMKLRNRIQMKKHEKRLATAVG